ncbi:G5 domain-containing protein [Aerococcaceae bacterium WGS1372]
MEQITVKLTPLNSSNPTITRSTTDSKLVLPKLKHDTYTLSITSAVYSPYTTQVVIDGDTTLNIHLDVPIVQTVEWRPMSTVTTIPITTRYVDDPNLNQGAEVVESQGAVGKTTKTWEAEYINGVATGKKRNEKTSTVPMVQRVVKRGTKVPQGPLVDVLTQKNTGVTYSTNTYVNNQRTTKDEIPTGGSPFELRQWESPSGGLNILDGDLEPNSQYTLAFEMENVGPNFTKAHFVIGMAFFGGKHYFNGAQRTVTPNAGEYNFTSNMSQSGKVTYYYQFTTEPNSPTGDYFQVNFDNDSNDTRIRYSKLALYKGHVNPYG